MSRRTRRARERVIESNSEIIWWVVRTLKHYVLLSLITLIILTGRIDAPSVIIRIVMGYLTGV
jgi:hypothetical protein